MAVDDTFSYTLLSDANEQRVKAEMTDLEDQLKGKGLEVNQLIVSGVSAGDEIIDASKKVAADLIVMSTHGRSGLSRWLLGNVAEKVLRHSEVPVLLVNARA
jgi:nucleotide-binding universal stress UspA family protein